MVKLFTISSLILLIGVWSEYALSFDIFDYQGSSAKLHGGAGITESRGGGSIFYNPANLIESKNIEYNLDVAPSSLAFKFTPAEDGYGTGDINSILPLVSVGAAIREEGTPLACGFIFVPTGASTKTEVNDFPLSVNGSYQIAKLNNTRKGYKLGFGLAYQAYNNLTLGMSMIYDFLDSQTQIFLGGQEFLSLDNSNQILLSRLGINYKIPGVVKLGLEWQPSVTS